MLTILSGAIYYGLYLLIIKLLEYITHQSRDKCDDNSCIATPIVFMLAGFAVLYFGKPGFLSFMFLQCWLHSSVLAGGLLFALWRINKSEGEEFSNPIAVVATVLNLLAAFAVYRNGMIGSFSPW